jgi:hypothetical protein
VQVGQAPHLNCRDLVRRGDRVHSRGPRARRVCVLGESALSAKAVQLPGEGVCTDSADDVSSLGVGPAQGCAQYHALYFFVQGESFGSGLLGVSPLLTTAEKCASCSSVIAGPPARGGVDHSSSPFIWDVSWGPRSPIGLQSYSGSSCNCDGFPGLFSLSSRRVCRISYIGL